MAADSSYASNSLQGRRHEHNLSLWVVLNDLRLVTCHMKTNLIQGDCLLHKQIKTMKIHELILENHPLTTDELVNLSDVSWSSCQWILSKELWMKWMNACHKLKEQLEVGPDLFRLSLVQQLWLGN